jgi:UDP-glucose 4-epimerase
MMRVGVTGAAGFIGSHLCNRLLDEGYEVVGVDDLSRGTLANLDRCFESSAFTFDQLDCTLRRDLRAAFTGCEAIFHLASQKIPRYGGALLTLEANVAGLNAACHAALTLDADLIVASTSDVYGNAPTPLVEDGPVLLGPPTTRRWSYAVSKLYDEHVALALAEERALRVTILRLFNVYGPGNDRSWWGGPLSPFIERLLDGNMIEIHGDGQQTRCFTYVTDTVDGFVRALRTPEARGEVINVGGDVEITIVELAECVQAMIGIPQPLRAHFVPYSSLPGNYQDVRNRLPDLTKARDLLGFEAQVGLSNGLEQTIAWHRACREADVREVALA